ncbi:C40 family peptidase [Promicromonospora sukumoe]|uniref:C40 family peptidase n=1 Tax=Promicromonospora sukumoe TaxID=88382 RepID=UPI00036A1526|nr:C40 family peptidase [Promicromonospora sukumoe]
MSTRTPGRHRAAHPPITPLTPFSRAAARGISATARRGAVVAAGSGLLVSLLAAPANAAPADEPQATTAELKAVKDAVHAAQESSTAEVKTAALTTAKVDTAPAVKVAADSEFTLETGTIKVTPAPEPEPEPEPEPVVEAAAPAKAETTQAVAEKTVKKAAAPAASSGSKILDIARQYIGVPYVWGGSTPAGFDCSGFTSYVYAQIGITLPHSSAAQRNSGTQVSAAEAQPGDIIWSPGHVAIYAGNGMQIEAPVPGQTVRESKVWQDSPVYLRIG